MLEFAAKLGENADDLFLWIIDKRFCVLTKLVDYIIEPVIRAAGHDFYRNGYPARYCNWVHFGLTQFAPPQLYDAILATYDDVARAPSHTTVRNMQITFRIMANSAPEEVRPFLKMADLGAAHFYQYHDLETFDDTHEVQLTSGLASVSYWRQRRSEDFVLYHDASNNFFNQKWLWDALTSDHVPPQLLPIGDGTSVEYPLRIRETHPARSEMSFSIQFADVCAGLFARTWALRKDEKETALVNELLSAGLGKLTFNGIRPELEFIEGPPAVADGPDAVDKMTAIIFGGASKNDASEIP